MCGIVCGCLFSGRVGFLPVYGGFFVLVSCCVLFWKKTRVRTLFFLCIIFLCGFVRVIYAFWSLGINSEMWLYGEQQLTGYISAEPDIRQDGVRYSVTSKDGNVKGKIYVPYDQYPVFNYGDVVDVRCRRLEKPEPIEDFRYDMYLARFGISYICRSPEIKKIGEGGGYKLFVNIFSFKDHVADRVNRLWHEPYAGFMAGLLYGYRGGLGSLNDLFAKTGVTHIIAISGYNITIVATILITLCIHLCIPRKRAFYLVVTGIVFFVLFTGASASVVRAGIMGVLVLFAQQRGRRRNMHSVLICTVMIMVVHNPFVLLWDAGFQLSFLATVGLLYIAPIIEKKVCWLPRSFGLRESFSSTISAILVTLPLILFQFGRLSVVAPVVNMLILCTIPFIMLLGFFGVVVSFVSYPLAKIISWVAWFGMGYVVLVVQFFASLPFSYVDVHIPLIFVFFCYVGGFFFYQKIKK